MPGSITHSAHASGTARSIGQLLPTWKRQLNTANLPRYATGWPIKPELSVIKVFLTKWRRLGESWQLRLRGKANASRLRLFRPLLVDSPPDQICAIIFGSARNFQARFGETLILFRLLHAGLPSNSLATQKDRSQFPGCSGDRPSWPIDIARRFPPPRARCANNSRWVCENHGDRPSDCGDSTRACTCGGAGMPRLQRAGARRATTPAGRLRPREDADKGSGH
jgi:hypothetical protein